MRKTKLSLDTLQVETFEPEPGAGDVPGAWTEWECGTYGQANCQPLTFQLNHTCGADITCQYYNCDD
jgi:hypothetical protein